MGVCCHSINTEVREQLWDSAFSFHHVGPRDPLSSSVLVFYVNLFMYICDGGADYVHMSTGTFRGQKPHVPLDLAFRLLWAVNQTAVLWKSSSYLYTQWLHHLSSPCLKFKDKIKYAPNPICQIEDTNTHILLLHSKLSYLDHSFLLLFRDQVNLNSFTIQLPPLEELRLQACVPAPPCFR